MSTIDRLRPGHCDSRLIISRGAFGDEAPRFEVDARGRSRFPTTGSSGNAGIAVDAADHIWIIERPRTPGEDEKGAMLTPPRLQCCEPAPPVIEFDRDGTVGKPGAGRAHLPVAGERARHTARSERFRLARRQCAEDGMILQLHARRKIRHADRQGWSV